MSGDEKEGRILRDPDDAAYGFTQIVTDFIRAPGLSHQAFRLYCLLRSYAWSEDRPCFPGHQRLARSMGVTSRTVIRAEHELVEKGCIEVERDVGRVNHYRVLAPEKHPHVQQYRTTSNSKRQDVSKTIPVSKVSQGGVSKVSQEVDTYEVDTVEVEDAPPLHDDLIPDDEVTRTLRLLGLSVTDSGHRRRVAAAVSTYQDSAPELTASEYMGWQLRPTTKEKDRHQDRIAGWVFQMRSGKYSRQARQNGDARMKPAPDPRSQPPPVEVPDWWAEANNRNAQPLAIFAPPEDDHGE